MIRVLHLHKQGFLNKFSLHGRVRFEIVHPHEQDFLDKLSFCRLRVHLHKPAFSWYCKGVSSQACILCVLDRVREHIYTTELSLTSSPWSCKGPSTRESFPWQSVLGRCPKRIIQRSSHIDIVPSLTRLNVKTIQTGLFLLLGPPGEH